MAAEANLQKRVAKKLKELSMIHPLFFWKTHGGGRTKSGIPDLCITFYGISVYIELKAPGEKATKLQEQRIAEIRRAGGVAGVADDLAQVIGLLIEAFCKVPIESTNAPKSSIYQ